jgi:hypothetical protein
VKEIAKLLNKEITVQEKAEEQIYLEKSIYPLIYKFKTAEEYIKETIN